MFHMDTIRPELIEAHYKDFEEVLLAAYSQKNYELFCEHSNSESYMEMLLKSDINVKKELAVINNAHKKKNIGLLADALSKVSELIRKYQLNSLCLKDLELSLLTKALIKEVIDFSLRDEDLFSGEDEANITNQVLSSMLINDSILTYFGLHNDMKNLERLELEEERKLMVQELLMIYLAHLDQGYRYAYASRALKGLEQSNIELESQASKRSKVINKYKKELESHREEAARSIKNLESSKEALDKQINQLKKELDDLSPLKTITTEYKKMDETYQKKLTAKENELSNLHQKYSERGKTIKGLEKALESCEKKTELEALECYLKEKGLTQELYQLIAIYSDSNSKAFNPQTFFDLDHINRLGYCRIHNNKYYFMDETGVAVEMLSIPKDTYLTDFQFVSVNKHHLFIEAYNALYREETEVKRFGRVIATDPYYVLNEQNMKESVNDSLNIKPKKDRIIGIDEKGRITCKYKLLEDTLAYQMASIKAKGHELLYIEEVFGTGCKAYDLIKDDYTVVAIEQITEEHRGKVITVSEGKITKVFHDNQLEGVFSNGNLEHVFVEKWKNQLYIVDQDHNRTAINHYYFNEDIRVESLKNGDLLEVGRFNHVLRRLETQPDNEVTIETKIKTHKDQSTIETAKDQESLPRIQKDLHLLIIGKESLKNAYTRHFSEAGYKASFVPGHDPYFKIVKKAKTCDVILFISTAAAHENYYRLKAQYQDQIIYADQDGPNRLLELVDEWERKGCV